MPRTIGVPSRFQIAIDWLLNPSRTCSAVERSSHQLSRVAGAGVRMLSSHVIELTGLGSRVSRIAAGGNASASATSSVIGSSPAGSRKRAHISRSAADRPSVGLIERYSKLWKKAGTPGRSGISGASSGAGRGAGAGAS